MVSCRILLRVILFPAHGHPQLYATIFTCSLRCLPVRPSAQISMNCPSPQSMLPSWLQFQGCTGLPYPLLVTFSHFHFTFLVYWHPSVCSLSVGMACPEQPMPSFTQQDFPRLSIGVERPLRSLTLWIRSTSWLPKRRQTSCKPMRLYSSSWRLPGESTFLTNQILNSCSALDLDVPSFQNGESERRSCCQPTFHHFLHLPVLQVPTGDLWKVRTGQPHWSSP